MEQNQFQTSMTHSAANIDAGLRAHFVKVYNIMTIGLVITGITAWFSSQSPAMMGLLAQANSNALTGILVALSPMLIIMFAFNPMTARRLSAGALGGIFMGFSAYLGWLLSTVFLVYTSESIARVFFITAATFLAMSIWGQTTRKDLSSMGSFLMMGIIGLIIASVVNIFLGSSMLQFMISAAGVLIYTLMVAFDTQSIKQSFNEAYGHDANTKMAIFGALSLYLDFIMLFQFLLQFLGNNRE